jgi:hypothetical protein
VTILVTAGLCSIMYAWALPPPTESLHAFRVFVVTTGVAGMCALTVELTAFSLWWHFLRRPSR